MGSKIQPFFLYIPAKGGSPPLVTYTAVQRGLEGSERDAGRKESLHWRAACPGTAVRITARARRQRRFTRKVTSVVATPLKTDSDSGFVDCKWFNLNAPGSYTPWCHPLLGSAVVGFPFLYMQEKGMLHVTY